MNQKELTKLSKFISLVLRHRPELIGIEMDDQGWVDTRELIDKSSKIGQKLDLPALQYIVENNNKKRFLFNEDQSRIRASQGHSVKIDLGYKPVNPPEFLYHGTTSKYLGNIMQEGLKKRKRHHVHLSADKETARQVGGRHGKPKILIVHSGDMQKSGYKFYQSDNGVWLTDHVPENFISLYQT